MAKKKAPAKTTARISDMEEKRKALGMTLQHLEKDFGSGAIMRLGDDSVADVEAISTGSIGLDYALGIGGIPRGRITEIYGPDAEHAFDRFYAEKLGVDVNNLWIAQPDNGEQALEIAEQLINSGAIDVLVIDSVAALTPKAEIEGEMGDKNVGLHARLMSQAMRKLTGAISRTRTCCIFINQIREKIGVMFGNPETTTGGNALKFYASVRIDIRPSSFIKEDDKTIGRLVKVKVVKNKVAPPFMKAEFDIIFGEGISRSGEILDFGVEMGIIKKSGAWFSYNGTKLGQGRDAVKRVIADNPELASELAEQITAKLEESRKHPAEKSNPFLPGKESTRSDDEDRYEDSDDRDDAGEEEAPEDLFGIEIDE